MNGNGAQTVTPLTFNGTQNGSNVTGTVVVLPPGAGGAVINGTVSGTAAVGSATLTVTFPVGAFTAVGSSTCSMTATINATVTTSSITGALNETFAQVCVGTVSSVAAQVEQLTLNK